MNVAAMLSMVANVAEVSPDPDWHDNAVLLGELATINARIARYITRALDADAKRGEPISLSDAAALGRALIELGEQLDERSQRQSAIDVTTAQAPLARDGKAHGPIRLSRQPGATRLPTGKRADQQTGGEVNDMEEATNNLVIGVTSTPVVQDRTEIQLSDGFDDGETQDPV
jgi:hypothetical protein